MHRYLPFAASDAVTVNELAPNYRKVQNGLPPAPSTDFATVSNNPVGSFLTVPSNYKNAYAQQFNFGVEHELTASNIVLKAFYLGNLGRDLDINYNYNQAVPGPGAIAPRMPLYSLAPGVVGDTFTATDGNSNYHSLQLTAEKRFSNGLSFLSAYSLRSLDRRRSVTGGRQRRRPAFRRTPATGSSTAATACSTSGIALRQTLLYDLPFGQGKRFHFEQKWANTLFGNWQVNMILIDADRAAVRAGAG